MKVMFINSVVDYGSTGKIVRDLANGLISKGHEVLMVYGRHQAKETDNTFDMSDTTGFYNHVIMTRLFGDHGLHSKAATHKLIEKIKEFQPDTIHIHNIHGYYCHVPMLMDFLKETNIKVLWTLHDAWLISGSGAYFDFNGCSLWNDGCEVCTSTKDYPEVVGIAQQKRNLDWKKDKIGSLKNLHFITPSHWLKDLIAKSYLGKFSCSVVHNGINLDVFKPTENADLMEQYKGKKILLGIASKWERRKGLEDFMKLSTMLSDEYQIVLIGLEKEQIGKLPSNVVGISRTQDATELAAYYTLAHAFLNPTYEDNYPTTNIEALSCNTPVIAYDTGGNKEVPGITIVPQGDLKELIAKVEEINPDQGLSYRNDLFSAQNFVEEMMDFYEENYEENSNR